jgi:hypothetical protein
MDYELLESHTAADNRVYDIYVKNFGPGIESCWGSRKPNQLFVVIDRELDEPLEIRNSGGRFHFIELRSARNKIKKIPAK